MCGRYSLFTPPEDIEASLDVTFEEFQPRYNAAPGQSLPVVADTNQTTVESMEWGFVPPWAEDRSEFQFINARAETIAEKPTFQGAFQRDTDGDLRAGRCLVPADGFYEWVETDEGKQPVRVTLTDESPFAMAGLYAEFRPETTQTDLAAFGAGTPEPDDEVVSTFAIVTTEPNDFLADLHHRMAVILPAGEHRRWLREGATSIEDLLVPYPAERMRAYPVSEAVNDPSNDSPAVAEPLAESADQSPV